MEDLIKFNGLTDIKTAPVRISDILANPEFNCRGPVTPSSVVDLVRSIEQNGLIQPVTVCLLSNAQQVATGYKYRLLAGYRRHMAHKVMNREFIHANIRDDVVDDASAKIINLAENIERKDLSLLQEAKALESICGAGVTRKAAAERLGQTGAWIQIRQYVMRLPEEIHPDIENGNIGQVNIRELYAIMISEAGKSGCIEAAKRIKDARIRGVKGTISVKPKKEKVAIAVRTKGNIEAVLIHLVDTIGSCALTRGLAWACGNVDTATFTNAIKTEFPDYTGEDFPDL